MPKFAPFIFIDATAPVGAFHHKSGHAETRKGREITPAPQQTRIISCLPPDRSGGAGDVACHAAATGAAKRDVGARKGRHEIRVADYVTGAGRAAERHSITIVRDELECLGRVVGGRSWLAHWILQKIPTAPSRRAGRRNRTGGWSVPPADNQKIQRCTPGERCGPPMRRAVFDCTSAAKKRSGSPLVLLTPEAPPFHPPETRLIGEGTAVAEGVAIVQRLDHVGGLRRSLVGPMQDLCLGR